ncbi:MAG TPA: adenylate/guanylate cyclase domain-containing protein [Herpetosiphonaceae bacterium]
MPDPTIHTFLFTDIEGSTRLWEQGPQAMEQALQRHDALLRAVFERHGGRIIQTVGDSFRALFASALDGVVAALALQRALAAERWETAAPLRVRIVLHMGAAQAHGADFIGGAVTRAARLLDLGHGGQLLLTESVRAAVAEVLPPDVRLRDLGSRMLKDLAEPERIFQLVAPDLPAVFAPLRSLDRRSSNVPVPPTSLVGRGAELRALHAIIADPAGRVLTLLGPGGTGKTRLSIQLAHELLDEFQDGAWFVALAPINDPQLVTQAVAQVVGVKEEGGRTLLDSLGEHFQARQALLILDNFEQVVTAAVPLLVHLQSVAPQLKIVVSSRELLDIVGERAYQVPPLGLPVLGGDRSLAEIGAAPAVALFVERSCVVKPDFALTAENAPAVAELCVRLDGLPLAIELAAARARLLSPEAMLKRLGRRLAVLTDGARDLPARQRTLRGAIDWSYQLLSAAEQRLFAHLAVFVNGCTVAALLAVEGGAGPGAAADLLRRLERLARKSLLRLADAPAAPAGSAPPEPRFLMLETIREYAAERLDQSPEAAEVRGRHAGYALALAGEASGAWDTPEQAAWLARLDLEQENMRAALGWLVSASDAAAALPLALNLHNYWFARGNFSESRRWIEAALALGAELPPAHLAKAHVTLGHLTYVQGAYAASIPHTERGIALYRTLDDPKALAHALSICGMAARNVGDFAHSAALLDEALALVRATGDRPGEAQTLNDLGVQAFLQGDIERGVGLSEQSLALFRELGMAGSIGMVLNDLAEMVRFQGDYGRAAAMYEESLVFVRQGSDQRALGIGLANLAGAVLMLGEAERARRLFNESLVLLRDTGLVEVLAYCVEGLAGVAALGISDPADDRAPRLFAAAEAMRRQVGGTRWPADQVVFDRHIAIARERLPDAVFAAAEQAGAELAPPAAFALALTI